MNAGDLVKECFSDRVLILGGGMEGERIRIAPPLTIASEDLRDALEIMLSRLSTASRQPRHGHGGMSLTARRPDEAVL